MTVGFIEGARLTSLLRGPEKSDTCVLDVRDDDFRGGHIPGCLNIWSDEFADDDDVDSIIQKHALGQYKMIVVTCFMSQQRGPFCARRLASRLETLDVPQKPVINVLYGGMRKFKQDYSGRADLLED
ncbi:g12457 [Coccomyxa viridis]|uniref:G12457 protein n=1 Tax=Coccomyxa viridis TaxID=1274662 RepID=A0ABP1GD04_9CHLO